MTVSELIEILKAYPHQEDEVIWSDLGEHSDREEEREIKEPSICYVDRDGYVKGTSGQWDVKGTPDETVIRKFLIE